MASTIKVTNINTPDGSGSITVDRPLINTGDFTVTSGDLVFSTAGKGVCLGVTSNTDANTLDDYEEGTWTPTLQDDSASNSESQGYNNAHGLYVKIGTMVFIEGYFNLSSYGSLTTSQTAMIAGLPFTVVNQSGYGAAIPFTNSDSLALSTATINLVGRVVENSTTIRILEWDATGGVTACPISEITTDGNLGFSGCYNAAS